VSQRVPALSQTRLEERPNSIDYTKLLGPGSNLFFGSVAKNAHPANLDAQIKTAAPTRIR
jgi:hypothetical protein